MQTFVVQLAGPGTYVPTSKSIAGGAYGAVPASTVIGDDGGKGLWNGDSLQIMFVSSEAEQLLSTVQAYQKDGAKLWNYARTRPLPEDAYFNSSRDERTKLSKYEAIIPLTYLKIKGGEKIRFNAVVFDDNSGKGQNGWRCLTRGLAGGIRTELFDYFVLTK